MTRRKGFPLGFEWGKNTVLWNRWDRLSPEEREDYEEYYEARDNKEVDKKIKRGHAEN